MVRQMGERQRWAWLLAASSVGVASCLCGINWLWVLLGGIPVTLVYVYADRRVDPRGLAAMLPRTFGKAGKALALLALLWTVVLMAWAANLAIDAFPTAEGNPTLSWVILALAAWSSWKGCGVGAGCTGVLCLFMAVLYGIVVIFSAPDVQLAGLRITGQEDQLLPVVGVFLLPACLWALPASGIRSRRPVGWAVLLPLGAAVLAALTAGVLSPELAGALPTPLYTVAQSLSLFGVIERIEPMLSVALTMGSFALLAAMASACQALGEQLVSGRGIGMAACAAAGILQGLGKSLQWEAMALGNAAIWGIIPLLTLMVGERGSEETP